MKKQKWLKEYDDYQDETVPTVNTKGKPIAEMDRDLLITKLVALRVKKGYSRHKLVEVVMKNRPVKRRAAYKIVKEAFARISEAYNAMLGDALADSINFLENLKEEAMREKNQIRALEVQKEINKITQLYVRKQEVTVRSEQPLFGEEDD